MSLDCGPTRKKDIKAFWDSTKSKKVSTDLLKHTKDLKEWSFVSVEVNGKRIDI